MQALSLLNHWLNGLGPAVGVAFLLTLLAGWIWRQQMAGGWWRRLWVTTVAAVLTQMAGLWWFGQDGTMLAYAGLMAVCATVQCLFLRPWQRFKRRRA
jgi:hypothetical protein